MATTDNGTTLKPDRETPNYAEMADRLRTVGQDLLQQGQSQGAQDLIDKARHILSLAEQICPQNGK